MCPLPLGQEAVPLWTDPGPLSLAGVLVFLCSRSCLGNGTCCFIVRSSRVGNLTVPGPCPVSQACPAWTLRAHQSADDFRADEKPVSTEVVPVLGWPGVSTQVESQAPRPLPGSGQRWLLTGASPWQTLTWPWSHCLLCRGREDVWGGLRGTSTRAASVCPAEEGQGLHVLDTSSV